MKNTRNQDDRLIKAINDEDYALVRQMLENGADPNSVMHYSDWTVLMESAFYGRIDCLKALIEYGADVNTAQGRGITALIYATERNSTSCLRALIDAGADINATKSNGHSALIVAAQYSHTECMILLAQAGADIECLKKHYPAAYILLKPIPERGKLLSETLCGAHDNSDHGLGL